MGFIQAIINYMLWLPCKWILELLNGVNDVVNYLASDLLESILFGGKVSDWSQVLIPSTYFRMLIVAGVCWLIFLAGTFICHLRKDILEYEETPISKKIWESLKYSTFSAILLVFIPLFIWLLIKITSVVNEGLMLAFGAKNASIGDLLYNLGNPKWDGTIVEMNGRYPSPSNLAEWNMVVQLLGLCIVFLCLLLVMINIVVNIFAIFFYFILTAFYALTSVFDQGARMKDYTKTMIANNLVICSSMLIFSVYCSLITISFKATANLNMNGFTRMLLQLALAAGGGLFVVKGDQYVSRLVGENISGTSDAMSGLGMVKAGIMMGTGLAVAAGKLTKKGLVGKSKTGRANKMLSQGGSQGLEQTESNIKSNNVNQEAKNQFIQSRQEAMQRYQKNGPFNAFALAGAGVAATFHTAKGTKNLIGSVIGTKASRMMAREQLKQQTSSVKGGFSNFGKKLAVGAGITAGAAVVLTGLNKTSNRRKQELGNAYNDGNLKIIKKEFIEKHDSKLNKLNPKNIYGFSEPLNGRKKVKESKIIKKRDDTLKEFEEKFNNKVKKWEKFKTINKNEIENKDSE